MPDVRSIIIDPATWTKLDIARALLRMPSISALVRASIDAMLVSLADNDELLAAHFRQAEKQAIRAAQKAERAGVPA